MEKNNWNNFLRGIPSWIDTSRVLNGGSAPTGGNNGPPFSPPSFLGPMPNGSLFGPPRPVL
jgi:hypothetical protein